MSKSHLPRARKRFGQHFLKDPQVLQSMLRAIAPQQHHQVIEIGPGQGALTDILAPHCQLLDLIEIDRDLIDYLKKRYPQENISIHQQDALQLELKNINRSQQPLCIVGNLPYNISSALLFHLLAQKDHIAECYFLLQKEVVDRICAKPNSKRYGRLTVMIQYHCETHSVFDVPKEAFDPPPKVWSSFIYLKPHKEIQHKAKCLATLAHVVRQAFSQRRKTIANGLKTIMSTAALESININPTDRPENLSVADYVRISNEIELN